MNIPNITGLIKVGKTVLMANRPEILFGASITATMSSVILAAKGGYESGQQVCDERVSRALMTLEDTACVAFEAQMLETPVLTLKEKARLTWKNYLPAAAATIGSLGSTTGLHIVHINDKKKMTVAALAAVQEVQKSANEFVDDVKASVEENVKLTEAKREAINNAVLEKQADRNDGIATIQNSDGVIEELYLVRDARSGRDIWSNQIRIEDAVNRVNQQLAQGEDCNLNEFYSLAGFASLYPEGDDWGWSGALLELTWRVEIKDDGRPVREFSFRESPKKGYDSAH